MQNCNAADSQKPSWVALIQRLLELKEQLVHREPQHIMYMHVFLFNCFGGIYKETSIPLQYYGRDSILQYGTNKN
jgi:hypothetical protein